MARRLTDGAIHLKYPGWVIHSQQCSVQLLYDLPAQAVILSEAKNPDNSRMAIASRTFQLEDVRSRLAETARHSAQPSALNSIVRLDIGIPFKSERTLRRS